MAVEWSYMDECRDNPDYDLCGKSFGKYVDVIQHGCDSDVWDVTYDNATVASNITGRDAAQTWAEQYLSTQESIITQLTKAVKGYC